MFSAWEANPNQRSSSVWIDRSKEYGTSSDPWSHVHSIDEGIVQSMMIDGAPWEDYHYHSHLPDYKEDCSSDLDHPSVFDFLSNTVNTVDSEQKLSNIEETITINISTKPNVVENIHVGKSCSPSELEIYYALFREFRDVFAWSYGEVSGIDSSTVEHKIKMYPDVKPVRQWLWQVHPKKAAAIKAEVAKLLHAGFIYSVPLTDWVSNIVLVMKKQGMIRVVLSPLSPIVANLFMEYFEKKALDSYPLKPAWWKRFVDDTNIKWTHVSKDEILLDLCKFQAIIDLPPPSNLLQIQKLQGKAKFLRRFIPNYVELAKGYTRLLKKEVPFIWDQVAQASFDALKESLIKASLMYAPNYQKYFNLYLAAADTTIAMVLVKEDNGIEHPIYYLGQKLNDTETKYSYVEKLALLAVQAIQRFRHYILFRKTTILSNCNPMTYILSRQLLGGKYSKWIAILQEFDMEFVKSKSKKALVFT
eukprot:PITA_09010